MLGGASPPDLEQERWAHSAFVLNNLEMVVCGGKGQHHSMALSKDCVSLSPQSSAWTTHSSLNEPRIYSSAVTMTSGDVYILGGWYADMTSELLRAGTSTWSEGPHLPYRLDSACALPLDDNTFVIIGAGIHHSTVSRFNTATDLWDHTWPQLPEGLRGHSCARLGSLLLVAGGFSYKTSEYTDSALTIDAVTGMASFVAKMNSAHAYFSLLTIGDSVLAIGGVTNGGYTAEVEVFIKSTKSWSQSSNLTLNTARSSFATLFLQCTPAIATPTITTTKTTTTTGK